MDKKKSLGILAAAAAAMLLFTAVAAGPTFAARGGDHGKPVSDSGGGGTTGTATCSATPNPVAIWDYVTINGSGFPANSAIGFSLHDAMGTSVGWMVTDASGNLAESYQTFVTGTTTVSFGGYATCSFQVN